MVSDRGMVLNPHLKVFCIFLRKKNILRFNVGSYCGIESGGRFRKPALCQHNKISECLFSETVPQMYSKKYIWGTANIGIPIFYLHIK